MSERDLMLRIRDAFESDIHHAVMGTSVPPAFIAALTANESAGDPKATRFESHVFGRLSEVVLGERPSYSGVITAGMLLTLSRENESHAAYLKRHLFTLRGAATSWGLTQIMGWHMVRWGEPITDLLDPTRHYGYAMHLLGEFIGRFQFDPARDFEGMARAWNSGSPTGKTHDPDYVPNLLRRMQVWNAL